MVGAEGVAQARLDRLDAEGAAILRLASPAIRGHTLKVLRLGPAGDDSDVDRELLGPLRARIEAGIAAEPRLRERLEPTPLRLAPPAWVADESFAVGRHVRAHSSVVSEDELPDVLAQLMQRPLAPDRPLWGIDLATLADGGAVVVCRIHHALADGAASMRIMDRLLWGPEPSDAPSPPQPAPGRGQLIRAGLADRGHRVGSSLAAPLLHRAAWADRIRGFGLLARVLQRELGSGPATPTVLDSEIGPRRELAWARIPLAHAQEIAHAVQPRATVNDVLLATVGGALRSWLPGLSRDACLRVKVPVSMHRAGEDPSLGNRDSFFLVDLDAADTDPASRLRRISAQTAERKHSDAETMHRFVADLRTIAPLGRLLDRIVQSPREFTVEVSNVRGPDGPVAVADRPVRELLTFAEPAQRHALRVTAISCAGALTVGLCTDPSVAPDPARLASAIEREVAASRAAVRPSRARS